MPQPEEAGRLFDALLWPKIGVGEDNKPVRGPAVPINVWWVGTREYKEPEAGLGLDAVVNVDRDVVEQSLLWLGTAGDWYGTGSDALDEVDPGIHEVVEFKKTPDLKGRAYRRKLRLRRYQGALPPPPRVGTPADKDLTLSVYGILDGTILGCSHFEGDTTLALTRNELTYQEWNETEAWTGTGTGTWDDYGWTIQAQRYLVPNTVYVNFLEGGASRATYYLSGEAWDGVGEITLTLISSSNDCDWPETVTLRGAD